MEYLSKRQNSIQKQTSHKLEHNRMTNLPQKFTRQTKVREGAPNDLFVQTNNMTVLSNNCPSCFCVTNEQRQFQNISCNITVNECNWWCPLFGMTMQFFYQIGYCFITSNYTLLCHTTVCPTHDSRNFQREVYLHIFVYGKVRHVMDMVEIMISLRRVAGVTETRQCQCPGIWYTIARQ